MKLHRYVDHQRLHIVTKDVISLSISVLLLFTRPRAVAGYYAVLAVLLFHYFWIILKEGTSEILAFFNSF